MVLRIVRAMAVAIVIAANPAVAGATADPSGLISQLGTQALDTLSQRQLSAPQRESAFRRLVDENFDFESIGRFVLGRYGQSASPEDRRQFAGAFEDYMVRIYSQRLSQYGSAAFKVVGERPESDGGAVVMTSVLHGNDPQPVRLDWSVVRSGGSYKITDISVAGVSMALTEKEQFATILQRNGGRVSGLTQQLHDLAARTQQ